MTEKHYGGASSFGAKNISKKSKIITEKSEKLVKAAKSNTVTNNKSEDEDYQKYVQAGKIASEAVKYAKSIIKPGMPLLEIAEKIERKIEDLGAKPAFPINLSINEIAAHSTPGFNNAEIARDLLKVDIGVHISGFIADTAFSLDLENSEENKNLISAAESALNSALNIVKVGIKLKEIGKAIENTIKKSGFRPIVNLSGHSIDIYDLHAGMNIPNYDNSQEKTLESGTYAIEPFATLGSGSVRDGKPSGIYILEKSGNVRDSFAREVLQFIAEEYKNLPFCSRWIYKKFGSRGLLALRRIEESKLIHHYHQLVEISGKKVAQAEHTVILTEKEKIITTQQ